MDEQSKTLLTQILSKHISAISTTEKIFLKARRSYLTIEQREIYASIIGEQVQQVQTEKPQEKTYVELFAEAKRLGYKGPRLGRDKLDLYLSEHKL